MNALLEALRSDVFYNRFWRGGTTESQYRSFAQAPEVIELKHALIAGEIGEQDIEPFVNDIVKAFVKGFILEHDEALGAIAVALEDTHEEWAVKYLEALSKVNAAEMSFSTHIAKLVLKLRNK